MTNHKFTPGPYSRHVSSTDGFGVITSDPDTPPWVYKQIAIGAGEKLLAEVRLQAGTSGGYPMIDNATELEATAALFIAAPVMLDALKAAVEVLPFGSVEREFVRVAIEKAEGRELVGTGRVAE